MKPTSHLLTSNKRHSSESRALRTKWNFPQIDQSFHTATLSGGCGARARFRHPSFREISDEYFNHEAPRNFVAEAAFFTAIILTVAVPILNSAQALAELVKSASLF